MSYNKLRFAYYAALAFFMATLPERAPWAHLATQILPVALVACLPTLLLQTGAAARYALVFRSAVVWLAALHFSANATIYIPKPDTGGFFVMAALSTILAWWMVFVVRFTSLRPGVSRGGSIDNQGIGDSETLKTFPSVKARYTFASIKGMEDFKKKAKECIAELREKNKNGFLLSGLPGNGKTMFAEALAGELGLPIISVTSGDFASRWINQTTQQLSLLFQTARESAPCVLFFDEIEALIKARENLPGNNAEDLQIVNTMLTNLVSLRGTGVILIGATNHPDMLDSAAKREGRFDFKLEVPPPDLEARTHLMSVFLPKGASYEAGAVERAVRRWEGFSVVRIRTVVEKAADMAKDAGERLISFERIALALRDIQGTLGERLAENTMSLDEMTFSPKMKNGLQSLAGRMMNITEIEESGGTVPRGVLFYGPPGTGKTATAKALAKTAKWAFLGTSGQELQSDAGAIETILAKAMDIRPCIVFIDEADDVLQDRGTNPWSKAATNRILQAVDGTMPLHDVVLVAATNHPDMLDSAATRGGRFSERFEFELPGAGELASLVAKFRNGSRAKFAANWSDEEAADLVEGKAPADVRDLMQKAVNLAIGRPLDSRDVTTEDLRAVLQ